MSVLTTKIIARVRFLVFAVKPVRTKIKDKEVVKFSEPILIFQQRKTGRENQELLNN